MTPEAIKALRLSRRETQAQFAAAVGTTVLVAFIKYIFRH
jgi:transcriptional regulator with XRE-family HTH domain